MTKEETLAKDKEIAKGLVGKTITLSQREAFFVEPNNQYTLNGYGDEKADRVVIQEGWKLEPTLRNVRAGVLRVLDKSGKDVSQEFGGSAFVDKRRQAVVDDSLPRMNHDSKKDTQLQRLLERNDTAEIMKIIAGTPMPYEVLQRLLDLELAGENPSFTARAPIVDGIRNIMKSVSGMTAPGKIEEEGTVTASKK